VAALLFCYAPHGECQIEKEADLMKKSCRLGGLLWLALCASVCVATQINVPEEIAIAAPDGTKLLTFEAGGMAEGSVGAAVYETPPDANDVRFRTLTLFRRRSGHFVPEVTNDKIIACSKCSQFHDDPFDSDGLDVSMRNVRIEQMDSGEKPSTTTLDFAWKNGAWRVAKATRVTVTMGRYATKAESLPLPASGLLKDMDAQWRVPQYLNTLVINPTAHKFMFLHGDLTQADVQKRMDDECRDGACQIAVQQHDGCIALARDASHELFGGATANAKGSADAASKAMAACHLAGDEGCEAVRTDCSVGVLNGNP